MFAQSMLGDSFSNIAATLPQVVAAAVRAVEDITLPSWLMIGAVVFLVHLLWTRRPSR